MKKLLFLMMLLLLTPALALAANSSCTITESWVDGISGGVLKIEYDWVADDADGSVPSCVTTGPLNGYVIKVVVNPGAGPPTATYDATLADADVADVMGGELTDLGSTVSTAHMPLVGTDAYQPVYIDSALTFAVTGNTQNSAAGSITAYVQKPGRAY